MKFNKIDKICIIGRSGCGKSFLGRQIATAFPRKIIFDPLDEYETNEKSLVATNFESFSNHLLYLHNTKAQNFTLIVKIDTDELNFIDKFDFYMRLIYELGNMMIVIEEVQDFCTPYYIGRYFRKSMTSGRHRDLSFIFTTQRPSFLNKNILSQSTHVFVGNLIDKNDVTTVSNVIDAEKKQITQLDDCQFLWFSPKRKPHTILFISRKMTK